MRLMDTWQNKELNPFQSTHPVWDATLGVVHVGGDEGVSIHAPRVGCDAGTVPDVPFR